MKVLKGAGCVTNNKLLLVILEFLKEFLPFQYGAIVQMLLITSQVFNELLWNFCVVGATNHLNFDVDPDHDPDPQISLMEFLPLQDTRN